MKKMMTLILVCVCVFTLTTLQYASAASTSTAKTSKAKTSTAKKTTKPQQSQKPKVTFHTIPYPAGYDTKSSGASSYDHSGDHPDSQYFAHPDYYNMTSTKTLTLISKFKTYQQTTESTCGPCAALTVLNYYGNSDWKELDLAKEMNTSKDMNGSNKDNPGHADERGEYGTSTENMVKFFQKIGWDVDSSMTKGVLKGGATFDDPSKFTSWVTDNLKNNTPIMVEWIDWYGHWQVVIGYDTMGTDSFGDDVLILADPYDTSDHLQDGYYTFPAERFYYMWQDAKILPENQTLQQWLIAKPKVKK